MTGTEAALLCIRRLQIAFRVDGTAAFEAVRGISFDVPANSTLALVGESGCGKSVTALAVMGLLPEENATVRPGSEIVFLGRNLLELSPAQMRAHRGRDISMIFQEPMSSLNPVFTVGYQLAEVLVEHLGLTPRQARSRAIELLGEVGMPERGTRVDSYPFQLSGGQQQRVMIAMAIACEPRLLIADEPTTALDVTIQKQILDLIAELQRRRRMSVLFISHDLAVVGEIADRIVVMRDGEIREQGHVQRIFESPQDPYTRALLRCRPQLSHRPRRLPVIDDFLNASPASAQQDPERSRGLRGDEQIVKLLASIPKGWHGRHDAARESA